MNLVGQIRRVGEAALVFRIAHPQIQHKVVKTETDSLHAAALQRRLGRGFGVANVMFELAHLVDRIDHLEKLILEVICVLLMTRRVVEHLFQRIAVTAHVWARRTEHLRVIIVKYCGHVCVRVPHLLGTHVQVRALIHDRELRLLVDATHAVLRHYRRFDREPSGRGHGQAVFDQQRRFVVVDEHLVRHFAPGLEDLEVGVTLPASAGAGQVAGALLDRRKPGR